MKVYQVFLNDIWNNNYLLGFYKDLDDAIEDINGFIDDKKYHLQKGDLQEYPSTFSSIFDTNVADILASRDIDVDNLDDDVMSLEIRGFILDSDAIRESLASLES